MISSEGVSSLIHKTSLKLRKASLNLLNTNNSNFPTSDQSTMPSKLFRSDSHKPAAIKLLSRQQKSPKLPPLSFENEETSSLPTLPSPTTTFSQPSSPGSLSFRRRSSQPFSPSLFSNPSTQPSTPTTSLCEDYCDDIVGRLPVELLFQVADIILLQAIHSLLHTPSPKFMRPGYEQRVRAIFGRPALNLLPLMLTSKRLYSYITSHPLFAQVYLYFLLNSHSPSPVSRDCGTFTVPIINTPRACLIVRSIRGRPFPEIQSLSDVLSCRYEPSSTFDVIPAMHTAQMADPDLFTFDNLVRVLQNYGAHHGNDVLFECATNREEVIILLERDHDFWYSEKSKSVDGPLCALWRPEIPLVTDEWKKQSQYGDR